MPLDPRLEAVRATLPKDIDRTLSPQARRQAVADRRQKNAGRFVAHGPQMADVRDLVVPSATGDIPVRVYRPRLDRPQPALVYIHGGGWWQGSIDDNDDAARRRALGGGCVVLSIGYRLAPEFPFPAGLNDCLVATRWIAANASDLGIDSARIAIGGSSAGANLATAVALRCRDEGGPELVGMLLEMPGMDLATLDSPSMRAFGEGHGFTMADIAECIAFYLGDHDPTDPLVSPVYADLAGLPAALVTAMECDPFRDSAETFAQRLDAAGVPVTSRRFDGMAHGCAELDRVVPEIAADYSALVHRFLQDRLAAAAIR